jgi:hypothetical protein
VIKIFLTATVILLTIISCNSAADKSRDKKEQSVHEVDLGERSNLLVYLDTAENMYNLLCQDWAMEDDVDALSGMDDDSKFEIPYRSFYFAANGTFIKNPRNAMDYGNWEYDDIHKTITLHYAVEKGKDIYKIAALGATEMKLRNNGINTSTVLKFISSGKRFKNPADDPFYIDNNRWRIKPATSESDSAIEQRLKDNLHFFILFYKSAIVKNDKTVSFWGLPSCFKWYGGGVFIKKPEELKDNWIHCYYNKEQAMKAYALAEKLMEKKYNWPKGESNWLKLNLAVLEQMYMKMAEIH